MNLIHVVRSAECFRESENKFRRLRESRVPNITIPHVSCCLLTENSPAIPTFPSFTSYFTYVGTKTSCFVLVLDGRESPTVCGLKESKSVHVSAFQFCKITGGEWTNCENTPRLRGIFSITLRPHIHQSAFKDFSLAKSSINWNCKSRLVNAYGASGQWKRWMNLLHSGWTWRYVGCDEWCQPPREFVNDQKFNCDESIARQINYKWPNLNDTPCTKRVKRKTSWTVKCVFIFEDLRRVPRPDLQFRSDGALSWRIQLVTSPA